ncbi:MAG TPA: glycosyltransferase [Hyphomicrobiaceae bacterium]|nr:glycosyltransferase [Hyphomicrobiaceae bacterium]
MRRPAQPLRAAMPPVPRSLREYDFLLDVAIDRAALEAAGAEAARCGVAVHEVLLACGRVTQDDYAAILAEALGVPLAGWNDALELDWPGHIPVDGIGFCARAAGGPCRVLDVTAAAPGVLHEQVALLRQRGIAVVLATRLLVDAALEARSRGQRVEAAARGLLRRQPKNSAGAPFSTWQMLAAVAAAGIVIGGLAVHADAMIAAMTTLMGLPFLCVTALRLFALRQALAGAKHKAHAASEPRLPDHLLPVYTVLVPVFREARVLPGLIQSLRALDYPAAKLEILIVLEEVDTETQAALLKLALPGNFRSLVVPSGGPQTKPKALNYALQVARGEFVVVYDAEDRPQPAQLRRAWEVFRRSPRELVCLQAQLNIYNPRQSWLTRQFTIEYSVLFDSILPALERLGLPVPLGGTSNHFPRKALIGIGGWDPFNVTEDADLGVRIARLGYKTGVLASTTWEEAPPVFRVWLTQRTRWLKGWMQTYLVHTRELRRLNRELGLRSAVGFHALMGGLIGSALVHPLFYLLLAYHALSGSLLQPSETMAGAVLWTIAVVNLAIGYGVSILVGIISVWRRRRRDLAVSALLMPAYWLLISIAAYRAVWQLARHPYLWEKTEHGLGRRG